METQGKLTTVMALLEDVVRALTPEHSDLAQLADEMLSEADWLLRQYRERSKVEASGRG